MDDTKYGPTASWADPLNEPAPQGKHEGDEANGTPDAAAAPESAEPAAEVSPAVERFQSCRWRATPDAGDYCTHRDVLPFAGKEGFKPDSWCPECAFYKLRRTPKKRDKNDYYY